ncbi:uncharacterized protein LOC126369161 [Pectinophora gossypiella]|uniref:uncharacterized protein LOC126369161 n=1 Tax=Pectinophora gossypiella TaxID=13191 RepID=UPI00214EE497|nr:uncharacterized protein LOC126369161 [Pectinophora gossypiella]
MNNISFVLGTKSPVISVISRNFSVSAVNNKSHSCKLLVVGGGSGGCTIASKFVRKAETAKSVIILEPSESHYYQPLWTLVGAGVKRLADTRREARSVLPSDAVWLKDSAASINPREGKVTTEGGDVINYEYLVIAVGLKNDHKKIPGLLEALENKSSGVSTIYDPKYCEKTFADLQAFQGGDVIFTYPNCPIKCPGAPQKIAYLTDSYFTKRNIRSKAKITYNTCLPVIFGVKKYADSLLKVVERKNIAVNYQTVLTEVDPECKEAVFTTGQGPECKKVTMRYDVLHVTPPMSTPTFLAQARDLTDAQGFLDVDKHTLQHVKYPNIYGIGDCTSTPNSKTAAAIAKQSYVLEKNLLQTMRSQKPTHSYDGYGACPLVTSYNTCILAEFIYGGVVHETFPFNQAKERVIAYYMKRDLFPFIYWNFMLKGWYNGPEFSPCRYYKYSLCGAVVERWAYERKSGVRISAGTYLCRLITRYSENKIIRASEGTLSSRSWLLFIYIKVGSMGAVVRPLRYCCNAARLYSTNLPTSSCVHRCKLLVVGAGTGGCSIAWRFANKLKENDIIILEPSEFHYYQPLFTLIAAGIKKPEEARRPLKSVLPPKVCWIRDHAQEFDPDHCVVRLRSGDTINYQFMVVALGLINEYEKIPGLRPALDDPFSGVSTIYSPCYCYKTWCCVQAHQGGHAVFSFPQKGGKCAGAAQKIMYLADDYWRKKKLRNYSSISYNTGAEALFGVTKYAAALGQVARARCIVTNLNTELVEIQPCAAIFMVHGQKIKLPYTLLHVTPPMRTPDCLHCSTLATETGHLDVDRHTLQHIRYSNIYGLGDCTSTPNSKTAAAVAPQSHVVEQNLWSTMSGKTPQAKYDGYGSCPMLTSYRRGILAEFLYDKEVCETFPFDQSQERRLFYHMKTNYFPYLYWNKLIKGKWNGPQRIRKFINPLGR